MVVHEPTDSSLRTSSKSAASSYKIGRISGDSTPRPSNSTADWYQRRPLLTFYAALTTGKMLGTGAVVLAATLALLPQV